MANKKYPYKTHIISAEYDQMFWIHSETSSLWIVSLSEEPKKMFSILKKEVKNGKEKAKFK